MKEVVPEIITDEGGARRHFQELKKAGFEIYAANKPLTEPEFVALALVGGIEVVVRPRHDMGGTGSQEEKHGISSMTEEEAREAYRLIEEMGNGIFLAQVRVTEDEFVQLAAQKGRVNLRRVSPVNKKVTVAYGAEIGFSRAHSQVITLPKDPGYVM